ncbi:MAG: GtrA family protein [Sphingomonas sp.]|nr:GtrA family protein [Sphingomonas sp.]
MRLTITSTRMAEFARFLIVGGTSALINTIIIVLLTELLRIDYLISYAICFACVTLFGFLMNRSWSFRVQSSARSRELGRYVLITIGSTALAMAASKVMVVLGMPYPLAVFLSAGLMAPLNFISHRSYSFGLSAAD